MNITETLKKTRLFNDIDETIINNFAKIARIKNVNKGTILFLHLEKSEYFYILISGWVKLYRETLDGQEAIIDIVNDNNILGETALFNESVYSETAEIIEDSKIIMFPTHLLKRYITQNPQIALKMLSLMSDIRSKQQSELEHRNTQNAPQRIGCFLLRLCKQDSVSPVTLHLPYDKVLVASRLGMQAETFSRGLNKLREATDIQIKGSTIMIPSLEKIIRFSCNSCSSTFPCQDL